MKVLTQKVYCATVQCIKLYQVHFCNSLRFHKLCSDFMCISLQT